MTKSTDETFTRRRRRRNGATVTAVLLVLALLGVAARERQNARGPAPADTRGFEQDAGGASAVEARRLMMHAATAGSFGLINGISFCPNVAYLSDPWRVYEVDLANGRVTRMFADTPPALRTPNTIAAGVAVDCDAGVLYRVEHLRGVRVLRLADGETVRSFPRPEGFVVSSSGNILLEGGQLLLPGLWPSAPGQHTRNGPDKFYEAAKFGWSLDVATGRSDPRLEPLDVSCPSIAPAAACYGLPLDRWASANDAYWVYAQSTGTSFGIADQTGRRVTRVSVRSPRFTRVEVAAGASPPSLGESLRLGALNSLIDRVFASAEGIAVVHSRHANTTPPIQFLTHLNFYDRAGTGLISDLRLPDQPIGRDDSHLYVIDYGPQGRREDATEIALVAIPLSGVRHAASVNRR